MNKMRGSALGLYACTAINMQNSREPRVYARLIPQFYVIDVRDARPGLVGLTG